MSRLPDREPPPGGVRIRASGARGFRVFATRRFEQGETVERAPVVDFSEGDLAHLSRTALGGYATSFGDDSGNGTGFALGYGALYGHSEAPCARVVPHVEDRVLEIVAARAVAAGEEILVDGPDDGLTAVAVPTGVAVDPPADVVWGESPGCGRGVFAARAFDAGELIERTPCLTFPAKDWPPIEKTRLDDYCFVWGSDRKEGALPLGYGSVYNHSYRPNATYVRRLAEHLMEFVAIRDIAEGDEIRTNYNRDPDDMSPVWFEVLP